MPGAGRQPATHTMPKEKAETKAEYAESTVRKFMTVLFTIRAKRYLRALATHYGWSPETLAAHEERFLKKSFAPYFAGLYEK